MQRRAPWYLLTPTIGVALVVAVPIVYLIWRGLQADAQDVVAHLFRKRTFDQLVNTVQLTLGVLVLVTAIALPMAWLTTQTDLRGRRIISLIGVLPLAVPGYIMAYALLSLGGYGGPIHALTGETYVFPKGYGGALLTLGLYNLPYMYLSLRAAMLALDPSIEEAGRSLGHGRLSVFVRVMLPQLRPALLGGGLLVCLHVIGDFAVVSLMNYETFSYALYDMYDGAGDPIDAAAPALMLIALAALILIADAWFLRGLTLHRTTATVRPPRSVIALKFWALPAYLLLGAVALVAVVAPIATVSFWALQPALVPVGSDVLPALWHSLAGSVPAAAAATALAIPVALLARRYPSNLALVLERCAFAGYAVPALAFALSLIVFSLHLAPLLYQSFVLLIAAYAIHFLAEAVGPIRSGLYLATPRLEEASRGLGLSWPMTMVRVTLPLLRNSIAVAAALVFLSVMKELPLTMLLAPVPYNETLAFNVWSHSENAGFAEAAPFALCILISSAAFVAVILVSGRRTA